MKRALRQQALDDQECSGLSRGSVQSFAFILSRKISGGVKPTLGDQECSRSTSVAVQPMKLLFSCVSAGALLRDRHLNPPVVAVAVWSETGSSRVLLANNRWCVVSGIYLLPVSIWWCVADSV